MYEKTLESRHDAGNPAGYLTETSWFRLTYLSVPPELAQHVTTFYHFVCDEPEIRDIQPASIGHFALVPHGEGAIHFRDGRSDPMHETSLLTPLSVAAPFTVDGPFHAIGAALTPLGWAELTGLCAAAHANRFYRAGDYLGEDIATLGAQWCAEYRAGTRSGAQCAQALGAHLLTRIKPLSPPHRQLIGQTTAWLMGALDPDIEQLYATLAYSRRQAQRLVERYFGLPPTALRRKYRALRVAAALSQPDLDPETEAAINNCYYDQPHMIREIRLFAGRTPARLTDEPDSFLTAMLDLRNLRELRPPKR
jgi:methylphosphotriester-DNA--protein-cysteine methyltransferase